MKQLRLILLVVLAVLLPLRGAAAAAMLCHGAASAGATAQVVGHDHGDHGDRAHPGGPHGQPGQHDHHAGHAAAQATAGATADDPPAGAHQPGTCQACASGCCLTLLGPDTAGFMPPRLSNPALFPAPSAPAPAFLSDGQDRPPRTI